ncbi:hypothetical protein Bbelb_370280 [Branchiostoma belcheri]|nr:hypothetical protein Bbelb_370280 [Branchiostoma belcheri]
MHGQQENSPRNRRRSSQSMHKPTHPPRTPQAEKNNTRCTDNDTDFSDFVGIERNRVRRKRFFLGYMRKTEEKSLQDMIHKYAQSRGVQLSFVRVMNSRQKDIAFARINVLLHQVHMVVKEDFWPSGVKCREWWSEKRYKGGNMGSDEEGREELPYYETIDYAVHKLEDGNDRIIGVTVRLKNGQKIFVFAVYMPYSGLAVDTYREHLDIIIEVYRKYENEGEVILVGDFNADIGEQEGRENGGPRGRGKGSKRGRELENIMEELALFSLNLSQLCKGPLYTFHDASGNHRSTIDHILVPYSLIAETVACEVMEDCSLNLSDHNPVVATFTNKPREWEEVMPRAKPRWHKADQEEKEMYRRRVKERQGASRAPTMMSTEDIENELRTITILIRTAEEVMPPKERKRHQKPYWSPELTEVHQQEVEAWLQWKEGGKPREKDNQLYRAYKESKNRLRTELREAKILHEEKQNEELAALAGVDDKEFWKRVGQRRGRVVV